MNSQKQSKGGFTLIELLVVIAIIGILSTIAFIALNRSRVKARDAKRIADITQLQRVLELYFSENQRYPPCETNGASLCQSTNGQSPWIYGPPPLLTPTYLTVMSVDPINSYINNAYYFYISRTSEMDQFLYQNPAPMGYPKYVLLFNLETNNDSNECFVTKSPYNAWSSRCVF